MGMTSDEKRALKASAALPPRLLSILADLPENVDRKVAADLITRHFFRVSHRSLESWSVPVRLVNGRAVTPTSIWFQLAHAKLEAAPVVLAGRKAV